MSKEKKTKGKIKIADIKRRAPHVSVVYRDFYPAADRTESRMADESNVEQEREIRHP
jgi:hypothetical protein